MSKIKTIFLFLTEAIIIFIVLNQQSFCLRFSYQKNNDFASAETSFKSIPTNRKPVPITLPQKNSSQNQNLQVAPAKIYQDKRLVIPKLKINAPIIFSASASSRQIKRDLKKGVVHYPNTAFPGEKGNVFIIGHSSNYFWQTGNYNQIFALLDKLKNGDLISVYYKGKKYNYRVYKSFQVKPQETWIMNPVNEPIITLMTCWPVGTNLRRLVVRGKLID